MIDSFDLQRFIDAQENSYVNAYSEIKNGRKTGHWIWYILPQIIDLGKSSTSRKYSIKSKQEAIAYYKHPVLGKRLIDVCNLLLEKEANSTYEIFGGLDSMKVKSSISLFYLCTKDELFMNVLDKHYNGRLDDETLSILSTL